MNDQHRWLDFAKEALRILKSTFDWVKSKIV